MSAAYIRIEFGASDPSVEEAFSEVWFMPSVASVDAALTAAATYVQWRRGYLAASLAVNKTIASIIGSPRLSLEDSTLYIGTQNSARDNLSSGALFTLSTGTPKYTSKRCFRGFPDSFFAFTDAGQEAPSAALTGFADDLLAKVRALGMGISGNSKNPATVFPASIDSFQTTAANVVTTFTSSQAGLGGHIVPPLKVKINGCKGVLTGVLNGIYRIRKKVGNVFSITPRKAVANQWHYDGGTGTVSLIVPGYFVPQFCLYNRFASRKVGSSGPKAKGRNVSSRAL